MLSRLQKLQIEKALEQLDTETQNLFILSPVTLARMGGKLEFFLGSFSNFFWELTKRIAYGQSSLKTGIWALIFSVFYLTLYVESTVLNATLQAFVSLVTLICIYTFNKASLEDYFPNHAKRVCMWFTVITAILSLHIAYNFYSNDFDLGLYWSELTQYAKTDWKVALGGLAASLFSVILIAAANSKKIKLTVLRKMQPARYKSILSFLNYTFVAVLISLVLFNWWRGLPEIKLNSSILINAITGLLALIFYALTLLEAEGTINTISGLNDDVLDGWSTQEHHHDLNWLLDLIANTSKTCRVHLLCGDIHTAGLSKITFGFLEKTSFYQITTSPISYETMPALVEKLTTSLKKSKIMSSRRDDATEVCEVDNIFYRSERNFIIIKPGNESLEIDYYFEDLDKPFSVKI